MTGNGAVAERGASLRQCSWTMKCQVEAGGSSNGRLDELQAAILFVFLLNIDGVNVRRPVIAAKYSSMIDYPAVLPPSARGEDEHVAHLSKVRSTWCDGLRAHLQELEIVADVHYPIVDFHQRVFDNRFESVSLECTKRLSREILTLPCYPDMTNGQVVSTINGWQL